jgi:hypothetical protein
MSLQCSFDFTLPAFRRHVTILLIDFGKSRSRYRYSWAFFRSFVRPKQELALTFLSSSMVMNEWSFAFTLHTSSRRLHLIVQVYKFYNWTCFVSFAIYNNVKLKVLVMQPLLCVLLSKKFTLFSKVCGKMTKHFQLTNSDRPFRIDLPKWSWDFASLYQTR